MTEAPIALAALQCPPANQYRYLHVITDSSYTESRERQCSLSWPILCETSKYFCDDRNAIKKFTCRRVMILVTDVTRKLSYRKYDRAVRPIYRPMGALKIFESPWWVRRPCGYFSRTFWLAFVPIDSMNARTKFEVRIALPVPEIIRGTHKIGQSLDTPTPPLLQNFNGLLFGWTLWMHRPNLKSVASSLPEIA